MSLEELAQRPLIEARERISALEKQVAALEHRKRDLRDRFAMAALQGLCSISRTYQDQRTTQYDAPTAATLAYQYADAMLLEREAKR